MKFLERSVLIRSRLLLLELTSVQCSQFQLLKIKSALYGVMANTVNFSTPGPPPLLHFSLESAKGSSSSTGLPPSVRQSHDPSSVHLTTSAHDSSVGQPFVVMFLNARISRCQGCRGKIEQGQPSPGDLVLQHKSTFSSRIRELEVGRCQRT